MQNTTQKQFTEKNLNKLLIGIAIIMTAAVLYLWAFAPQSGKDMYLESYHLDAAAQNKSEQWHELANQKESLFDEIAQIESEQLSLEREAAQLRDEAEALRVSAVGF